MILYKALNENLKNRYGFKYEIGKLYTLNGKLKWKENGFHFCSYPEDTLIFVNAYKDPIVIVEADAFGDMIKRDNEIYDFYDMYASSKMIINRVIPREEVFNMIVSSENLNRIKRYISLIEMTEEEKKYIYEYICDKYNQMDEYMDYYQNKEHVLKRKRELY